MRYNQKGEWLATQPTDLIGWEISIVETINSPFSRNPLFIIQAVKNDTHEVRIVKASMEAIPLAIIERFEGRK